MTDETLAPDDRNSPTWRPENDPDGLSRDDVLPRDWALYYLLATTVGFDDDQLGSFGLTMVCGGQVLSGTVISRKLWFESTQKLLIEKAGAPKMAGGLGLLADSMTKQENKTKARREAADLPTPVRKFIHLRDARLTLPNGDFLGLDLWRANIDDISGWSLGSHTPTAA